MDDFIKWSGWVGTIIGAAISIYQIFKMKKYKKEIDLLKIQINEQNNQILNYKKQVNKGIENYSATNKGVSAKTIKGDININ